jgi:phosphate/sulfate permease
MLRKFGGQHRAKPVSTILMQVKVSRVAVQLHGSIGGFRLSLGGRMGRRDVLFWISIAWFATLCAATILALFAL